MKTDKDDKNIWKEISIKKIKTDTRVCGGMQGDAGRNRWMQGNAVGMHGDARICSENSGGCICDAMACSGDAGGCRGMHEGGDAGECREAKLKEIPMYSFIVLYLDTNYIITGDMSTVIYNWGRIWLSQINQTRLALLVSITRESPTAFYNLGRIGLKPDMFSWFQSLGRCRHPFTIGDV